MHLTAKSRYALKIMLDLAAHSEQGIQKRSLVASRNGIPLDFFDQISLKLRAKGLLATVRGRNGGILLGREAKLITAWDIFCAVEDQLTPVSCVNNGTGCQHETICISHDAWIDVFLSLKQQLVTRDLKSMASKFPPIQKQENLGQIITCL